jgi:predicted nucleic acid-binding Zn finger protein
MWIVPSQAGTGQYVVDPHPNESQCTCPDYEMRGMKCKHIFAVEFAIEWQRNKDGSTTLTHTVTDTVKKPTYPQDWPTYNVARNP